MKWQEAVSCYQEGIFTSGELHWKLWGILTEDTIQDFILNAPQDIVAAMKKEANFAPRTDEQWDKQRIFQMGSWVGITGQNYQDCMDQMKLKWRRGVELLRHYLED